MREGEPTAGSVVLAGRRAVLEALRAGTRKVVEVRVLAEGRGGVFREVVETARRRGVEVRSATRGELDALAGGRNHQGVLALAFPSREMGLEELLEAAGRAPGAAMLVALDEVKDPQNVGAIMRTALCAGAAGIIMTEHRTSRTGPGVERASAGAVEYLPRVRVANLRAALERCRRAGLWVVGADSAGGVEYTRAELARPFVLVLGEEGKGLRRLTREACDEVARIPLAGEVASLNVGAAAAVILFEAVRKRNASC